MENRERKPFLDIQNNPSVSDDLFSLKSEWHDPHAASSPEDGHESNNADDGLPEAHIDHNPQGDETSFVDDDLFKTKSDLSEKSEPESAKDEKTEPSDTAEKPESKEQVNNKPDEKTSGNDETVEDPELSKLFDELEKETAKVDNPEIEELVKSLQDRIIELESETELHKRKFEHANSKLMDSSATDIEYNRAKPMIEKVEGNPELRAIITYFGDEGKKDKLESVISDMFEKLTGHNIGDLMDKSQKSKITSVMGSSGVSNAPSKDIKKPAEWSREDYETQLF